MSFPIFTSIPGANNDPADDQPLMQSNFANIFGFLDVDHITPGATNDGYHQQIHLLNQSAPGLGTANGVLYANAIGGVSYPIWQNAVSSVLPLISPVTANVSGSTTIPGGIVLKWGQFALPASSSSSGVVSFGTSGGNFPTACYNVQLTLVTKTTGTSASNNTISVREASTGPTGFTYDFNGNSGSFTFFNWFAIGI